MGESFDAIRFFDEMTAIADSSTADRATAGRSGLVDLRRIVDLGLWTMELTGLAFIEFGPAVGRVIVASGAAHVALGRRIESGDPHIIEMQRAGRVVTVSGTDLPADLRSALNVEPGAKFIAGHVALGGRPIGLLIGAAPPDAALDDQRRSAMAYLITITERLYREDPGLPLHANPAPRAPADTTVLLDREGVVCWINPNSNAVVSAAAISLGARLPLPLPGPGQVIEHGLPDGRWLTIVSLRLPDNAGHSINVRDVTEARRWEQSRELFVALASHELRTPVTVIKGFADTLNDRWEKLDDRGRRHAVRVLGLRATDLARLLDRLLTTVGEPGVPPTMSRFELQEAITASLDGLPVEARGRVRINLPPGLPSVFGETSTVSSVISELLTNAIKYAAPSAGPIDLTGVSDARTVGLQVSDRGIGVRPEHVESAFERFWQADTGNDRRYGGVGLGLYLVRRILERQNGWVSLRPRDGGGTIAEVRLPRGDLRA